MKDQNKYYFRSLLKKYRLGTATEEEKTFLDKYYSLFESEEDLITLSNIDEYTDVKENIKNRIDGVIAQNIPVVDYTPRIRWSRYIAAACLLFSLSLGGYFLIKPPLRAERVATNHDVSPGGNKATLTLADGRVIVLDEAENGKLAEQSGIAIKKTADGQLIYDLQGSATTGGRSEAVINTISTPKGGQYQAILPDGTRVWLNAASSISFPARFSAAERVVEMHGEAYFEVAKDENAPFQVRSGNHVVEVLGTHFNINSYSEEDKIITTLLEGSVKVLSGSRSGLIAPGQQSQVSKSGSGIIKVLDADTEKAIAWKNGLFSFNNDDIKSIMGQVARWYDVEVIYEGAITKEKFFGEISRSSKLSDVFKILELNNVHFKIKDKTVTVTN